MIWEIALGIVLGLIIWHWILPLIGVIMVQSAFWRIMGEILLYLSTAIGVVALINYFFYGGNTDWGLWFLVPIGIRIYNKYKKPKKLEKEREQIR